MNIPEAITILAFVSYWVLRGIIEGEVFRDVSTEVRILTTWYHVARLLEAGTVWVILLVLVGLKLGVGALLVGNSVYAAFYSFAKWGTFLRQTGGVYLTPWFAVRYEAWQWNLVFSGMGIVGIIILGV